MCDTSSLAHKGLKQFTDYCIKYGFCEIVYKNTLYKPAESTMVSNKDGVFYGTFQSEPDEPVMPAGKVTTYNGFKQIVISTKGGSFISMDFPNDGLTQYSVQMYLGT